MVVKLADEPIDFSGLGKSRVEISSHRDRIITNILSKLRNVTGAVLIESQVSIALGGR